MTENDVETSETKDEKEIIIDLEDKEDSKNSLKSDDLNTTEEVKPKLASKFVERKQIVDLTDDERALIVANAKNGLDQPNFTVKFFKNGKYRILKKKEQPPTISQKVISGNNELTKPAEKKVFYSDNQLLFEHIIELNAKVDRLMQKHKKLKKKYQSLQNDIYVDDEDNEEVNEEQKYEPANEQHEVHEPEPEQRTSVNAEQNVYIPPARVSWRNSIKYL